MVTRLVRQPPTTLLWALALAVTAGCQRPGAAPDGPERALDARMLGEEPPPVEAAPTPLPEEVPSPPTRAPGWTEDVTLRHQSHELPEGAPSAVVHAPAGLDPAAPLQLVVFLHGWSGCARVLARPGRLACEPGGEMQQGWGLAERHDLAGTDSVFVVLQLAYLRRSGRPGRLRQQGFFRDQLEELLSGPVADHLGRPVRLGDVGSVTLVAHSAGFEAAMTILRRGGATDLVRHVVLMDALYAGPAIFAEWVAGGEGERPRRIVSLYTGRGRTYRGSLYLAEQAESLLGRDAVAVDPPGDLAAAIRGRRVVIARSRHPHADVPARHLAEVLPALGLRPRATEARGGAPP